MTQGTCTAASSRDSDHLAWYEEWFDRDEYELVYRARDDRDARNVLDLFERTTQLRPGSRILDMACGRGRHSIELARRGYEITGVDLSRRSVEISRLRAAKEELDVRFVEGDMRTPLFSGELDGVVNLFTSFGYFESEDDHYKAIECMTGALKPGGFLFQDFLNARFISDHLITEDTRFEGTLEIIQQREIVHGRLNKTIRLEKDGESYSFRESVRLLELADFLHMYTEAGLRLLNTFGDYMGKPFANSQPRLILLAQKAGG